MSYRLESRAFGDIVGDACQAAIEVFRRWDIDPSIVLTIVWKDSENDQLYGAASAVPRCSKERRQMLAESLRLSAEEADPENGDALVGEGRA